MKQSLEQDLIIEFKKELKKLDNVQHDKIINLPHGQHKEFWEEFLNTQFPKGSINQVLEKNFAIWIISNKLSINQIKNKYAAQKWGIGGLLGWIKKVKAGEIIEYNTGELINWAKQFNPDLTKLLQQEEKEKPLIDFNPLSLEELRKFENSDGDYIVERLIPSASICALAGKRATMKSWLSLSIGICVAKGIPFLSFKTKPCGILYLDRENGEEVLKEREKMLSKGLGIEKDIFPLHTFSEYFKLDSSLYLNHLKQFVITNNIKLIICDVYRRLISFEENDANQVSKFFIDLIKPFCEETGVSFLFLHHEKKGESPDEMDNLRGSSDFVNYLDVVLTTTRKNEQLIIKQLKNRRARELNPFGVNINTDEKTFFSLKTGEIIGNQSVVERCAQKMIIWLVESGLKEIRYGEFISKAATFDFKERNANESIKELTTRGILKKGISKKTPYTVDLSKTELEDYFNGK